MRATREEDWEYLASLCDPDVRDAYARRGQAGASFSPVHVALRAKLDGVLNAFIEKLMAARDGEGAGGTAGTGGAQSESGATRG